VGKGVSIEAAAKLQAERVRVQQAAQPAEAIIPTAKQREVDELAKLLDGRVVRKAVKQRDGSSKHLYGRLSYRGRLTKYPKHFRVDFANGDNQLITLSTARAWLQPEGTELPPDAPALLSVALFSAVELPDAWPWTQPAVAAQAMEALTGVHMRAAEGKRLAVAIGGHVVNALGGHVGCTQQQLPAQAVRELLRAIDLSLCVHVLEPWHCTQGLGPLLLQHGPSTIRLSTNTLVHPPALRKQVQSPYLALDPLQPSSYRRWLQSAPAEVGVLMPPTDVADAALALALAFCSMVGCMLVPRTFFSDTSYFRSSWMEQLQREGRLVTLPCSSDSTPPMAWVLVFQSSSVRRRMLFPK
jgi:hypothetical protein